jgi:hypothetical protein
MIVNGGHFSYRHLIYYPHEGGSILVSLLAHACNMISSFNSLTIAAFLLDIVSRLIQLYVVWNVFSRRIAYLFGAWTIFAVPVIIPWATVSFGLHSLSSFFPFVLMYLLWKDPRDRRQFIGLGIFLGFAVWFSYSNAVLIIVYFFYLLAARKEIGFCLYSLGSLALVLALHLLVRKYADAGFGSQQNNVLQIRGTGFTLQGFTNWRVYYKAWTDPLASSATMVKNSRFNLVFLKYLWIVLVAGGFAGCLRSDFNKGANRPMGINLLTVFLFVTAYAVGPFYYDYPDLGNFVAYRHLTYILPVTALLTIAGLSTFRAGKWIAWVFIITGIYSSCLLFTVEKKLIRADKPAGWALGAKFGSNPGEVNRIVAASPYDQKQVMQGVGWGISAAMFEGINCDDRRMRERTTELLKVLYQTQEKYRDDLISGILFSFSDGITPVLDRRIEALLVEELRKNGYRIDASIAR